MLVDVGVFDEKFTKSGLFTWEELFKIGALQPNIDDPEFRYVTSSNGVQPTEEFIGFSVPSDLQEIKNSKDIVDKLVGLIETVSMCFI